MCDKEWEDLWRALEGLQRTDELTRKRVRSEPIQWFKKKEKKEHPA